jgi:cell division septation protein DedD
MNDTKDKSDEDLFSDSSELFESLFKEAPLEMEGDKQAKAATRGKKEVKPAPEMRRRGQEQPRRTVPTRQEAPPVRETIKAARDVGPPARSVDPARTQPLKKPGPPPPSVPDKADRFSDLDFLGSRTVGTEKANIPSKRKPSKKQGGKGSSILKLLVLLILLVVGASVAASYLGFVDFGQYIGWPTGQKVKPPAPHVAKPGPEKKAPPQTQARPAPQKPKPQPAPPKAAEPAKETKPKPPVSQQATAPAQDKLAKIEAPASIPVTQPKEIPARPETQASASGSQARVAQVQTPPPVSAQTQVPSRKETPPPPKMAAPQPAPVQQSLAKAVPPPSREQQPPRAQQTHVSPYPFSVYLGAFMNLDRARTAVSIYERDYGISSYWVKVDLGDKGTWYRVFTGYFESAEEAEAFVRQRRLNEGEVKQTKYSTLIGVFSSPEEAEATVKKLLQLGYSSYFMPVSGGRFKLYSGAFYTLAGAQQQLEDLASKGIKSQAVER